MEFKQCQSCNFDKMEYHGLVWYCSNCGRCFIILHDDDKIVHFDVSSEFISNKQLELYKKCTNAREFREAREKVRIALGF
jgi:hypothetical protein